MLDSPAMNDLRLRFADGRLPDLPLHTGVHALGRTPAGIGPVDVAGPALLHLCHDRRGIWMTVADGCRSVHVNGRPVRQVALLRPGDSLHVEDCELLLYTPPTGDAHLDGSAGRFAGGSPRLVLRGIGGPFHGRCLSLEKPRRVGTAANADLRIEGPGIAAEHAVLEAMNGHVLLHRAAADVMVNGYPVREAALRNGDQIVFGVQHRFVLEGPTAAASATAPPPRPAQDDAAGRPPTPRHWARRIPWLLVTALLLAGVLAALLVFGAR